MIERPNQDTAKIGLDDFVDRELQKGKTHGSADSKRKLRSAEEMKDGHRGERERTKEPVDTSTKE